MTDPRCTPWHARKFAARLQAAGPTLALLRVRDDGHGLAADRSLALDKETEWLGFVLQQLDMTPPRRDDDREPASLADVGEPVDVGAVGVGDVDAAPACVDERDPSVGASAGRVGEGLRVLHARDQPTVGVREHESASEAAAGDRLPVARPLRELRDRVGDDPVGAQQLS
jgi:hypothetical protein